MLHLVNVYFSVNTVLIEFNILYRDGPYEPSVGNRIVTGSYNGALVCEFVYMGVCVCMCVCVCLCMCMYLYMCVCMCVCVCTCVYVC